MGNDNCEVGYKKPPMHTRFPKGKSGNPKGRPKGSKNSKDCIEDVFFKDKSFVVNDKKIKTNSFNLVLQVLEKKALGGNDRSIEQVIKYGLQYQSKKDALSKAEDENKYGVLVVPAQMSMDELIAEGNKMRDKMFEQQKIDQDEIDNFRKGR